MGPRWIRITGRDGLESRGGRARNMQWVIYRKGIGDVDRENELVPRRANLGL